MPKKLQKKSAPKRKAQKTLSLSWWRAIILDLKDWWRDKLWHRVIAILLAILIAWFGTMFGIAQWYIIRHKNEPLTYGMTFIPNYAEYFGLDPKETMQAMIDDLGVNRFRLVSYWKDIENSEGIYDFSELDWQFEKANQSDSKVSLAIGLRQPRWPECHMPSWLDGQPKDVWYPKLKTFMTEVIERYKDNPALESYQLENEFFLSVFGICPDFSRDRLIEEAELVRNLDPNTKLIISRSNNAMGLPIGQPRPDEFAVSVYKRVWDKTLTKRYFEYPFPAWFYGFLAGAGEIITGKNMIIHELQTEPWLAEGYEMKTAPLAEHDKSLSAERLTHRIEYGRATGMRTIDLWGGEYWYWRMVKADDPSLWQTAKEKISKAPNE